MSEDKTEIPGNEEPTEVLEAQKAPTTQPMLKEILERMNEGFAAINSEVAAINSKVDEGFSRMEARFDSLERRMSALERKFDVLTIESMNVKTSVFDHEKRLEDLERKAS